MRRGVPWLLLALALAFAFGLHLAVSGVFSPADIFHGLLRGPGDSPEQMVLWSIRLPRACAAALIGAILSLVGAAFQTLFRNPLADPYIIGVSSGAAVGGAIASLLGFATAAAFGSAFLTALCGLGLVVAVARGRGSLTLQSLLISGVAVGSFLWALVTFFLAYAGQDSSRILFWLLGSFASMDWGRVGLVAAAGGVGFAVLFCYARPLTVFSVGEESSGRLGVEVERVKWVTLIIGTAMAAAAVAAVGIVGFVGLFVPHISRRIVGPSLVQLLPASAMLGAAILVLADLLAQRLVPGQEINIGVLTALVGAPFLIIALRRR